MPEFLTTGIKTTLPALNLNSRLGVTPLPEMDVMTTVIPTIDVLSAETGGEVIFDLVPLAAADAAFASPTNGPQTRAGYREIAASTTLDLVTDIPANSVFRLRFRLTAAAANVDTLDLRLISAADSTVRAVLLSRYEAAGSFEFMTPLMRDSITLDAVVVRVGISATTKIATQIDLISL